MTSPAVPELAGVPTELTAPVTRIATGASAPDALTLVGHVHTVVVAAPGPDRMRAAHLAHRLRAHMGLALDPEWLLWPGEKHLEQIGSVGIDEVNEVAGWLAHLTRRLRLPQKMLLIHQFRLSMVRERERLDTSRDELAFVIHMDGQGPQGSKIETWDAITAAPPDGVHFGWKNVCDEDTPVRSPEATMALTPSPVFVSYQ